MNRKTFAWILSVCMAFGLSACGLPQGDSSSLDSTLGDLTGEEIEDTGSESDSENDSGDNSENGSVDSSENGGPQEPADDGIVRILLVERSAGEADPFAALFDATDYQIDRACVTDGDFPATVEELCVYDEIVLNNIANADMPEGFVDVLYSYVNDFGGGLFTVGGNKVDENGNYVYENGIPVANAYNREDMFETLYQEMLPVQAIDYTPPVAVMIIVDRSGSMDMEAGQNGKTKLELAKQGAKACLDALTERDYCGIMTLEEQYTAAMEVLPMTQISKLQMAIDDIAAGGGTVFEDALRGAGQALQSVPNVERRHVILVTDGIPSDTYQQYSVPIEQYANDEQKPVTFSFVIIGEDVSASGKGDLQNAAELGGGRFYGVWDVDTLPRIMREELMMPEIKAINYEEFRPQICKDNEVSLGIQQADVPSLAGFYGTKLKDGAELILSGPWNVPIYAQWDFGEGKVGSFMCDLNNIWSADFMADATGKSLILNIVAALLR